MKARKPSRRPRLLTDILRDCSRAFYLTLRVLPKGVREPVGLAYLLARAADTVADTPDLAPEVRLGHLLQFRAQVEQGVSAEGGEKEQREHGHGGARVPQGPLRLAPPRQRRDQVQQQQW